MICYEQSVDIIRVAKWGFEVKLRKDRKKKIEESESKKASEYDIWVIAIGWTRVKAVWAVPIIQEQR